MSDTSVPAFPPITRLVLVASMTALFVTVGLVILYPLLAGSVFEHVSPRTLGGVLLAGSVFSLLRPAAPPRFGIRVGRAPAVGMALLGAAAAASDDRMPLLLIPSLCYGIAALVFWRSLEGGSSLIGRFVLLIHPYKPDFVDSYCRKITLGWGIFFALHGVVLAVLAAFAPAGRWEAYTGWVVLPSMLLASLVEYLVRKTWFRYYPYGGPIDRLFSFFFPAENTAAGRRSQAYIRARQAELGEDAWK